MLLNHICCSSYSWSHIKLMTICCHFPRFIWHIHRAKRQIKWGHWQASYPALFQPLMVTVMSAASPGLLSQEAGTSLALSTAITSSCVSGEPLGDSVRGYVCLFQWYILEMGSNHRAGMQSQIWAKTPCITWLPESPLWQNTVTFYSSKHFLKMS